MSGANNNRSSGFVQFAVSDTTGTVRIRGSDGTSRATVRMVDTTSTTAGGLSGTMTLAGHEADVLAGSWTMASRSGANAGGATALLTFDRGVLDIESLVMGRRTGSGTGDATATISLGGGTTTIGGLTMAVNTSAGGTSAATFNVSGGSVAIGSGAGTAITMATAASGRSADSFMSLTGGTVTLAGNVIRSGSAGTESALLSLDGGTLDLGGFAIGGSTADIQFEALTGTLLNLGELNGGGTLTKTGTGTLVMAGTNSYTGATSVTEGTLLLASGDGLGGSAAGTTVSAGAQLRLNTTGTVTMAAEPLTISGSGVTNGGALRNASGTNIWQGAITLAADATIGAASGTRLTLDVASGNAITANNFNLTFDGAGTNEVLDAIELGSGGITKIGTGTTILAGNNTYSGPTAVTLGTLLVNGTTTGGAVTVAANATLGGIGRIASTVAVSGTLSPGASIGLLTAGTTSFADGATYVYEVDTSATTGSPADLLVVLGDLTLTGSVNLVLSDLGSSTFTEGTTLSLVNYTGAWNSGLFSFGGEQLINGEQFTWNDTDWRIDYAATTGGENYTDEQVNGLFVNITFVPEPSTLALLAVAAGVAGWRLRRRGRRAAA
jgi:fibronectin-binding autotransporter adhesin